MRRVPERRAGWRGCGRSRKTVCVALRAQGGRPRTRGGLGQQRPAWCGGAQIVGHEEVGGQAENFRVRELSPEEGLRRVCAEVGMSPTSGRMLATPCD